MYRAIPVANKACAERARNRHHEMHKERIKQMKAQVDNSEPHVIHMDHVRHNLKREQMLEERYCQIDRDNTMLLQRMSEMMKQTRTPTRSASGPPSLGRDARKHELMRITQENGAILKRIQHAQPVYNHVQWEDSYRKSTGYLKNATEYPLVLRKNASKGGGSLTPASRSQSRASLPGASSSGSQSPDHLKYVLKQGQSLGQKYYLLEMATDGRMLAIHAYDGGQMDGSESLSLVVKEREHRTLYREAHGDYSLIAQKLYVDGGRLCIDQSGGPLGAGRKGRGAGAMGATM